LVLLTPLLGYGGGHGEVHIRDHGDGVIRQYHSGIVFDQQIIKDARKRYGSDTPWVIHHPAHVRPSVIPQLQAEGFWMFETRILPRTWWIKNQWIHHRRRTIWMGLCLLFLVGVLWWLSQHLRSLRKRGELKDSLL